MSDQSAGLRPGLERHIQTILAAVLVALVLWVGKTVSENSREIARMQEQTKALAEKVLELRSELVGRTSAVSQAPFLEHRVERLERRVQRLEGGRQRSANP